MPVLIVNLLGVVVEDCAEMVRVFESAPQRRRATRSLFIVCVFVNKIVDVE